MLLLVLLLLMLMILPIFATCPLLLPPSSRTCARRYSHATLWWDRCTRSSEPTLCETNLGQASRSLLLCCYVMCCCCCVLCVVCCLCCCVVVCQSLFMFRLLCVVCCCCVCVVDAVCVCLTVTRPKPCKPSACNYPDKSNANYAPDWFL